MPEVAIELLGKTHDRKSFDCGRPEETEYFRQRARKHAELGYSRTWVAVPEGDSRVLGYITLSMGSVMFETMSDDLRRALPRYPMPVLHIGRLATDREYQGRGIAKLLLRFAFEKAVELSGSVGCYAVEILARDDIVREFYLRLGFASLSEGSMHLYLPVSTIRRSI